MSAASRLFSIGALNLDLVGHMSEPLQIGTHDCHFFADFVAECGGVATNIAFAAARTGIPTQLYAIIGDDLLGRVSHTILLEFIPSKLTLIPIVVPNSKSGAATLLYQRLDESKKFVRTAIGPKATAIDQIESRVLASAVSSASAQDIVVFDGYLLLRQTGICSEACTKLREIGARACLELVPHEIWRWRSRTEMLAEIEQFDHVSCSMATLERILGLSDDHHREVDERVSLVLTILHGIALSTTFHLRYGYRDCEGVFIIAKNTRAIKNINYGIAPSSALRATGDTLFIKELFA